jgi:formamidopyrimidine-DNA glycosylase
MEERAGEIGKRLKIVMPELPEVETIVRELCPHLVDRTIVSAQVAWERTIAQPKEDVARFCAEIRGRHIVGMGRRGKFVLIHLSGTAPRKNPAPRGLSNPRPGPGSGDPDRADLDPLSLVIHLRMSGQLLLAPLGSPQHLRATFALSDGGRLYFYDQRKFGRIWLVRDPNEVVGGLGPEPLAETFTAKVLEARLRKRRGMLKPLLLNQRFIAGLGNIYVDESLFRAGLHPQRTADTLTDAQILHLHSAIREVLNQALDRHGTTFDGIFVRPEGERGRQQEGLQVYKQDGLPCVRCGTPIQRTVVGGRGTHFCPQCQPL